MKQAPPACLGYGREMSADNIACMGGGGVGATGRRLCELRLQLLRLCLGLAARFVLRGLRRGDIIKKRGVTILK